MYYAWILQTSAWNNKNIPKTFLPTKPVVISIQHSQTSSDTCIIVNVYFSPPPRECLRAFDYCNARHARFVWACTWFMYWSRMHERVGKATALRLSLSRPSKPSQMVGLLKWKETVFHVCGDSIREWEHKVPYGMSLFWHFCAIRTLDMFFAFSTHVI